MKNPPAVVQELVDLCKQKMEEGEVKDAKESYIAAVNVAELIGVDKPAMPEGLDLLVRSQGVIQKTVNAMVIIALNAHNNEDYDVAQMTYNTAEVIADYEKVYCRRILGVGDPITGMIPLEV